MNTKCNFPNDKDKRHDLNDSNEMYLNGDESLLRQPLRTSLSGFREAKRAYENGTDEVRHLLMQECSIIYECNACRNMFRSLANFISHKRIYCKQSAEGYSHQSYSGQNSSVIIQTIEHPEQMFYKSRSTGSSPVPLTTKTSNRDLSKIIERLKRVDIPTNEPPANPTQAGSSNVVAKNDPVLQLERVPTTTQAVYQTLTTQNACDSIKIELDEVHNLLTNQKTLLGADGKVVPNHNFLIDPAAASLLPSNELKLLVDECNYKNMNALTSVACEICKISFQTEKTLKIHIQKKHTSSTYVFQCPTCSLTFLQPAAVIRHLANEHKKPLRRIRKMRDTILKKRIQIGDVQEKGLSREVKRLQLNDTKDSQGNVLQQQNGKPLSSCSYCKKNFERRAALATHLNNCPAKKNSASSNCGESTSIKSLNATKTNNQMTTKHLEANQNQNKKDEIINMNKMEETLVEIKQEPLDELNAMTSSTTSINEMFENLEKQSFGNGLRTVSLDTLVGQKKEVDVEAEEMDQKLEKSAEEEEEDIANSGVKKKVKRFRVMPASKQLTCRCKICNKQFNALSNLRRHISMFHYRSRRFGCKLCDYRAFRRYDIVNHLTFVHKMTDERETMAVEHVTVHDIKYSKDDVEGDIVVVNEQQQVNDESSSSVDQRKLQLSQENVLKTYEKQRNRKKDLLTSSKSLEQLTKTVATTSMELTHTKIVRKKFSKKSLYQQEQEQQKRPIRNRIKTVNNDFVYDLQPPLKEESKEQITRLALKRRNTMYVDPRNSINHELTGPIKISPYRLRTEPLIPSSKEAIKGFADSIYRNVVQEALAAPSTLPELPTERPQMRPRHISGSRNESNSVPIIETSELDAARSKSTLFDDSFLEKFAKKTNPSFKMKPLLALQHSPLSSILQKFDTSLQNNNSNKVVVAIKTEENIFLKPPEKSSNTSPPSYTQQLDITMAEVDVTPNGKHILEPSSPPSPPKKRITLMQRLAENRARRRDSLLRNALEN